MSYTTAELVKKQALAPRAILEQQVTQEVTMNGADTVALSPGPIVSGSLQTLALTQLEPTSESVTFATSTVTLGSKPLATGSVIVADSDSLSSIYVEGADFVVNHTAGTVTRITGGAIQSGAAANIWYFPFQQYSEGSDYVVDYLAGSIRRVTSGQIHDGARILISYRYSVQGVDQQTYSEAASEANQMVSSAVDPNGEFGANLNLQTAATFLAAAIVCRIAATAALAGGARGSDASLWLDLSASFQRDATRMLDQFKPPRKSLEPPRNA